MNLHGWQGRRAILKALTAAVATLAAGRMTVSLRTEAEATASENWTVQTLLAFADTLIPGERRLAGDVVVAGAITGPGAVQAVVVDVLTSAAAGASASVDRGAAGCPGCRLRDGTADMAAAASAAVRRPALRLSHCSGRGPVRP